MSTAYHAKYFANELTRHSAAEGVEKLSRSLFDANVDLNPHQIEAALFAFRSPISKGVLLADEVGLGKTIEAGLVLCQYWAERKRKLLIICPASLRKQWSTELDEKFNLPSIILEAKSFKDLYMSGQSNPFIQEKVIITSYHFANRKKEEIRLAGYHLVVIDEAHKLRNVHRKSNKLGKGVKWATEESKKLLLTATPLQNSLIELYGLSTLIDDHFFGDIGAFRAQYMSADRDLIDLKMRLKNFTHRTLRSQVQEYIQYTERKAHTAPFIPTDDEQALYQAISNFLLREDTYAIPQRQRILTTLILRKLLASSSQAVAGTLQTMKDRLTDLLQNSFNKQHDYNDWLGEIVAEDEMEYEFLEEEEEFDEDESMGNISREKLINEIEELDKYITWARSIKIDSKTRALMTAIDTGFKEMEKMGANRKALIFTESKRTQEYLKNFLEANGFAGKLVIFNGTNTDLESKKIYEKWVKENLQTNRISGSKTADKRQALIDCFRNEAQIMIATESAAEGVNLQFCSLLINYDLPWNPQRIEQRIGRCHRYGQKHDVVVINFINKRNDADNRVYELLKDKFNLFSGVLGASDEVLGTIESGVDFEKRILAIYQECRSSEEIQSAFQKLQSELEAQIKNKMEDTRKSILEHFDEDVHSRLKFHLEDANYQLDRFSKMFWGLTTVILKDRAIFKDEQYQFELKQPIEYRDVECGRYQLISKDKEKQTTTHQIYRLSHPLGEYVLNEGQRTKTPKKEVVFNITKHPYKISLVEQLKGQCGYLTLKKLTINSYQKEEHLLFSGVTDNGMVLDQEVCERLFNCNADVIEPQSWSESAEKNLKSNAERHIAATISRSLENNNRFFQEERDRLEKWADDMLIAVEKDLNDTKIKIKDLKRQTRLAQSIEEQSELLKQIKDMERKQRKQRQQIFDVEDEIMEKRDELIEQLEKQLVQKTAHEELFIIRWTVI
ncbi:SNF2-related protein [Fictibacillus barbaricus]|uniref:Superfamily II DNA/RNA helicase n=1 Tax=Fictibacillus barbaricus TaxID=182136 RepID=A0ABU1U5H9_9BACL|nr:SNF2-related protein [Fictibacillus barbaricus]MDR7074744.1 superfamily II DNA/RNA helicase [Fictibacillus barbaricus]